MGAVGFVITCLSWILSPQYPFGDDNSAHLSVIVHVAEILRAGEMDFWWHHSNMGVPLFVAYQPFPALFMGALVGILGNDLALYLFKASISLTWALMPLAWYQGARWYGLKPIQSLVLGALTLCIHDPDSLGFGVRSSTLLGLYTQHFGLLFLPLYVGCFQKLLDGRSDKPMLTAVLFSLTAMSHLWVGLYAGIISLSAILANHKYVRRALPSMTLLCAYSFILLAWWLVSLFPY